MLAHNDIYEKHQFDIVDHVIKTKCEKSFEFYLRYMFRNLAGSKFLINEHHKLIAEKLQKVYSGEIKRLIINIPRRFGKTEIANAFISWALGKAPRSHFLLLSYAARLAEMNSYAIRETVKSDVYKHIFPEVEIMSDLKSRAIWRTTVGGQVKGVGFNGTIRGAGAGNVYGDTFGGAVVMDDPQEGDRIFNGAKRYEAIEIYQGVIRGCLNHASTPIILIMQRLHIEDLAGWLIEHDDDIYSWDVLSLPALKEDGTSLWPHRHSVEELKKMEAANKAVFAAQWQQNPYITGGNLFKEKYWQYYDKIEHLAYRFIVADTALKKGQNNDYSVFQCWGVHGLGANTKLYLLDQIRGKWEVPDLHNIAYEFYKKHNGYNLRGMFVEDKASGIGLIQDLKRKNVYIKPLEPVGDKEERANNVINYVATNRVYLPNNASWVPDFILEHAQFPNGAHDDQVDTTVYAIAQTFGKTQLHDYTWALGK